MTHFDDAVRPIKPKALTPLFDAIPVELRERAQWVCWSHTYCDGDYRKIPFDPRSGQPAKANDPSTWSTFDEARSNSSRFDGPGFEFGDGGFVGIDLDGCRDPHTGELSPFATRIIERFPTYCEVSPSGKGVKLFTRGSWPGGGKKRIIGTDRIEVYATGRYFAVTGHKLDGSPSQIADCQAELNALRSEYFAETPAPIDGNGFSRNGHTHAHDRNQLIERAAKYVATMPPAISGQSGHDRAFHVACVLVLDFGLSQDEAFAVMAEWNNSCQPPWSEKELRHKISDADKQPGERGRLAERGVAKPHEMGRQSERPRRRIKVISSAELAATEMHVPYLIERVLVARQPCILAGGKKCLKTNILIDMALSLAQAGLFLGQFRVSEAVRVAVLSGESGQATIAETALRIARAKHWSLENFEAVKWGFDLPCLGDPGDIEELDEFIREHELQVVIIDPTYLALPLGDSASNLFEVGSKLVAVNECFQRNGATPIFAHHTRKNSANPFEPPELEDIAWAGFQEWTRQWFLVGRRKKYDPEQGGHHELWLNVGGSAGHSSLWAVNIDEGKPEDEGGRRWEVEVLKPSQARAESVAFDQERRKAAKAEKLQAEAADDRAAILRAISTLPNGDTATVIRNLSGVRSDRFRGAFAELLAEREIEPCTITKGNNRSYESYRRSGTQRDATGHLMRPTVVQQERDAPL